MPFLQECHKKQRKFFLGLFMLIILFAAILPGLSACNDDPYAGMIQVSDGAGGLMWVPLHEDIEAFSLNKNYFGADGEFIDYKGRDREAIRGIDVSYFQGEIDWERVYDDGVRFAMLRVGYRGYSEGNIREDEKFRQYARGALDAGIEIGAYFFSQAVSTQEAREEALFVLSIIAEFDISYPVAFDWENIDSQDARTDGVSGEVITDCALSFCSVIERAGYTPAVYFYRRLGYFDYDLPRLQDLTLWVGAAGEYPDFYYDHQIWQYSFTGKVEGIETDVDLNLHFTY